VAFSRLDPDEKDVILTDTLGGTQRVLGVYEEGLYNLVLTSRKPEAKIFERWVFHDVLPGLGEHGCSPPPKDRSIRRKKDYAKLGSDQEWIAVREQGVEARNRLTPTPGRHEARDDGYALSTSAPSVLGNPAKVLRQGLAGGRSRREPRRTGRGR
jgi:hypothetical protein